MEGKRKAIHHLLVALLAEGVDRNVNECHRQLLGVEVALLAEGVDRNFRDLVEGGKLAGRPPRGGRG